MRRDNRRAVMTLPAMDFIPIRYGMGSAKESQIIR
jgi:hypothetical protein